MQSATISIAVDEDTAKAFTAANPRDRRLYEFMLALRLRELTSAPVRPVREVMAEMSKTAIERGLTPAELERMLAEE